MESTNRIYFCGQEILLNSTHGDRCHQNLVTKTFKHLHTGVYNTNGFLVSGNFIPYSSLIKAFLQYIIK